MPTRAAWPACAARGRMGCRADRAPAESNRRIESLRSRLLLLYRCGSSHSGSGKNVGENRGQGADTAASDLGNARGRLDVERSEDRLCQDRSKQSSRKATHNDPQSPRVKLAVHKMGSIARPGSKAPRSSTTLSRSRGGERGLSGRGGSRRKRVAGSAARGDLRQLGVGGKHVGLDGGGQGK